MLGIIVDIWLAILIAEKGWEGLLWVWDHCGASFAVALLAIDGPIFKIHFGLISRNEMAQEWKKNEHYVANNTRIGDNVPVEDLEDDKYNELFDRDAFVYDRTRNPFDNGCSPTAWTFGASPVGLRIGSSTGLVRRGSSNKPLLFMLCLWTNVHGFHCRD